VTNESPRDRMARHFGLGTYGTRLAEEILREYGEQIAKWLEADEHLLAAEAVREFNDYDF
jgi:hypothetical protein